jgi:hypothetical protein
MKISEIRECLENNIPLIWNDPEIIKGNDYTITYISEKDLDYSDDNILLILYNNGSSEAEVYNSEISKKS